MHIRKDFGFVKFWRWELNSFSAGKTTISYQLSGDSTNWFEYKGSPDNFAEHSMLKKTFLLNKHLKQIYFFENLQDKKSYCCLQLDLLSTGLLR